MHNRWRADPDSIRTPTTYIITTTQIVSCSKHPSRLSHITITTTTTAGFTYAAFSTTAPPMPSHSSFGILTSVPSILLEILTSRICSVHSPVNILMMDMVSPIYVCRPRSRRRRRKKNAHDKSGPSLEALSLALIWEVVVCSGHSEPLWRWQHCCSAGLWRNMWWMVVGHLIRPKHAPGITNLNKMANERVLSNAVHEWSWIVRRAYESLWFANLTFDEITIEILSAIHPPNKWLVVWMVCGVGTGPQSHSPAASDKYEKKLRPRTITRKRNSRAGNWSCSVSEFECTNPVSKLLSPHWDEDYLNWSPTFPAY